MDRRGNRSGFQELYPDLLGELPRQAVDDLLPFLALSAGKLAPTGEMASRRTLSHQDPRAIDDLVRLIDRGVVIAAASRYMAGGQQVGAPFLKSFLSRLAGLTLCWFARVGTHDATNSFKAYDRRFLDDVGIDSEHGFEMGIELVAKARRARLPVAEIPTIWIERSFGSSNFQVRHWLMRYLRWYLVAFGLLRVSKPTSPDISETTGA